MDERWNNNRKPPSQNTDIVLLMTACDHTLVRQVLPWLQALHGMTRVGEEPCLYHALCCLDGALSFLLGTCPVTQAMCKKSLEMVALKVYHMQNLCELNHYQVFREVRVHSSLQHQNIIHLFAAFQVQNRGGMRCRGRNEPTLKS